MSGSASRSQDKQVPQAAIDVVDIKTRDLHRFRQQNERIDFKDRTAPSVGPSNQNLMPKGKPASGRRPYRGGREVGNIKTAVGSHSWA